MDGEIRSLTSVVSNRQFLHPITLLELEYWTSVDHLDRAQALRDVS